MSGEGGVVVTVMVCSSFRGYFKVVPQVGTYL